MALSSCISPGINTVWCDLFSLQCILMDGLKEFLLDFSLILLKRENRFFFSFSFLFSFFCFTQRVTHSGTPQEKEQLQQIYCDSITEMLPANFDVKKPISVPDIWNPFFAGICDRAEHISLPQNLIFISLFFRQFFNPVF